jgi:hypothetical protein
MTSEEGKVFIQRGFRVSPSASGRASETPASRGVDLARAPEIGRPSVLVSSRLQRPDYALKDLVPVSEELGLESPRFLTAMLDDQV